MDITIKWMRKIDSGKLLAGFNVVLEGVMEISGCKLIEGPSGNFVAMPSRSYEKGGETKYQNLVYIIDKDLQNAINEAAEKEYDSSGSGLDRENKKKDKKWFD
jgi:DNA-binding cell septation regulator SpoVG